MRVKVKATKVKVKVKGQGRRSKSKEHFYLQPTLSPENCKHQGQRLQRSRSKVIG